MICRDDEIVRPLRKRWDKCNRLVVGSNPTRGVSKSLKLEFSSFRFFVFVALAKEDSDSASESSFVNRVFFAAVYLGLAG